MIWLFIGIGLLILFLYVRSNSVNSYNSSTPRVTTYQSQQKQQLKYWEIFSQREPEKAKDIEGLLKVSMNYLSDTDVKEKIYSIERLLKGTNCSISDIKKLYKDEISKYPIDIIPDLLKDLQKDIQNEALFFNIKPNNTISSIFEKWLQEYKRENFMRTGVIMTIKSSFGQIAIKSENNEIEEIPIIFNIKEIIIDDKKIELNTIEYDNFLNTIEISNIEDTKTTYWGLNVVDKNFDENKLQLFCIGKFNYNKKLIPLFSLNEVKYWNKKYGLLQIQEESIESYKEGMQSAIAFDNYLNSSNIIETIKHYDNMMNIYKKGTISF